MARLSEMPLEIITDIFQRLEEQTYATFASHAKTSIPKYTLPSPSDTFEPGATSSIGIASKHYGTFQTILLSALRFMSCTYLRVTVATAAALNKMSTVAYTSSPSLVV
jgi:ABC-type nitrate/sulfonate/bicarbonate transport system permease component